jgi:hypothetical protein
VAGGITVVPSSHCVGQVSKFIGLLQTYSYVVLPHTVEETYPFCLAQCWSDSVKIEIGDGQVCPTGEQVGKESAGVLKNNKKINKILRINTPTD